VGAELRVVSYNVHSLRDDRAALAKVVRDLAPDVVIVQEAPRRWRWRTKCAQLADDFGLVVGVGGLPSLGNLILTSLRVRVLDTWTLRYPLTPGRHMRGAAFARCAVPGAAPFVVAGTHLSTDDAERPGQAALLKPALTASQDPVVLGVDLNEQPDGLSWRLLADGLADAALTAGQQDRNTFSCSDPNRRIDAVLVDPRLRLRDYQVYTAPPTLQASDHFPLVVDLML
jgi:endonuclease/exonuclease/phosphatase family metal-dependent hydrolase